MLLYLWVARVKETNRAWGETLRELTLAETGYHQQPEGARRRNSVSRVLEVSLAGAVIREGGSYSQTMTGARNSGRNTVIFLSFTPLISCQCLLLNPCKCQGPGLGETVQRDQPPTRGTQQGGGIQKVLLRTTESSPFITHGPSGFADCTDTEPGAHTFLPAEMGPDFHLLHCHFQALLTPSGVNRCPPPSLGLVVACLLPLWAALGTRDTFLHLLCVPQPGSSQLRAAPRAECYLL